MDTALPTRTSQKKTVIRSRAERGASDIFPTPPEYHREAEMTKKKKQLVDTAVPARKPQKQNRHSIAR